MSTAEHSFGTRLRIARFAGACAALAASACGSPQSAFSSLGNPSDTTDAATDATAATSFAIDSGEGTKGLTPDTGCATASVQAKARPVYLLFVQDGSDSMAQENKWAAVVPALESIFAQMEMAADPGVAAGLILFPGAGGPYPAAADIPVAFVSAAQQQALDGRFDAGLALGTPTEAALKGGYGELESFQPASPLRTGGKKVLVLLTDGLPTDACSALGSLLDAGSNPCVELAASKLAEGTPGPIETFVIGVGDFPSPDRTQFDPVFLGNLAAAGGTAPAHCNPNETMDASALCYFEIDPSASATASALQQQFTTALDAIRGKVASCEYPIQASGLGQIDPTHVNVEIGGVVIPQGATNGWTYDNPTTPTSIELHGTACSSATSTIDAGVVSIVLGCQTLVAQ